MEVLRRPSLTSSSKFWVADGRVHSKKIVMNAEVKGAVKKMVEAPNSLKLALGFESICEDEFNQILVRF